MKDQNIIIIIIIINIMIIIATSPSSSLHSFASCAIVRGVTRGGIHLPPPKERKYTRDLLEYSCRLPSYTYKWHRLAYSIQTPNMLVSHTLVMCHPLRSTTLNDTTDYGTNARLRTDNAWNSNNSIRQKRRLRYNSYFNGFSWNLSFRNKVPKHA